jgi:hypothetical protein
MPFTNTECGGGDGIIITAAAAVGGGGAGGGGIIATLNLSDLTVFFFDIADVIACLMVDTVDFDAGVAVSLATNAAHRSN